MKHPKKLDILDQVRDAVFDIKRAKGEVTWIIVPEAGVSLSSDGQCIDTETGEPASEERRRLAVEVLMPLR